MPVEPAVRSVVENARATFESLGCRTEEAFPDLTGARDAFFTLRAHAYARDLGDLLAVHRERMKATVVWNIERGLALSAEDVGRAEATHAQVRSRAAAFFSRFDALVMPVSQVAPFPIEQEYPTEVDGRPMETYLDWMESCWCVTVTGCPAISVPCGFTHDGLPVGVQIVGQPQGDLALLQLAHAFERAAPVGERRPPLG
jgi:amidase